MSQSESEHEKWLHWIYSFYHRPKLHHGVRASREFARTVLGRDFCQSADVVQITGTNGKGSTATWCEEIAIAKERGRNVICVTSPHIHSIRERIRINGEMISKSRFCDELALIREDVDRLASSGFAPTPFQILVWLAFSIHKSEGGVGIYEVGAGGMSDGVNIFFGKTVAMTKITDDHLHDFGGTIEAVAHEKVGLCVNGDVLAHHEQDASVEAVIRERVDSLGIKSLRVSLKNSGRLDPFRTHWERANYELALAAMGSEDSLVQYSLKRVRQRLPYRLGERQIESTKFLLDISHNIDGIKKLLEFSAKSSGATKCALVAFSKNVKWKICMTMIVQAGVFQKILVVGHSRGHPAPPQEVARLFPSTVVPRESYVAALREVLDEQWKSCFVFGTPLLCADFERAAQILGYRSLIEANDMDPLQPWMNDTW